MVFTSLGAVSWETIGLDDLVRVRALTVYILYTICCQLTKILICGSSDDRGLLDHSLFLS